MKQNPLDPPALVREVESLAELASLINGAHCAGEAASRRGLDHFRQAGEMLLKAKEKCGHGMWLEWLSKNVRFSRMNANRYMCVAKEWDKCNGALHLQDALRVLTEDADEGGLGEEHPPDLFQVRPDAVILAGRVFATPFSGPHDDALPHITGEAWWWLMRGFRSYNFQTLQHSSAAVEEGRIKPEATWVSFDDQGAVVSAYSSILIDEYDNVIDGRQRLRVVAEAHITNVNLEVLQGLSFAEKERKCYRLNVLRRRVSQVVIREHGNACLSKMSDEEREEAVRQIRANSGRNLETLVNESNGRPIQ
jgi:hypothetical protein